MSRAFVKELEDVPERDPALRQSAEPVPITARGADRLAAALAASSDPAERQRLAGILARAYVVPPPADRELAAFGATVAVEGAEGEEVRRFTIVGPDEVDVPAGNISADSPLGKALLGTRAGDTVVWRRPAGNRNLTVRRIEY